MKLLFAVAVLALCAAPAFAEDRFGADNPTFQQFEATCRSGSSMNPTCDGSATGAYAARVKLSEAHVSCDFGAFWRVKDAKYANRVFAVLPWQYGVEELVAEPGVCKSI